MLGIFIQKKNLQITNEPHKPYCPYVHSPYVIAWYAYKYTKTLIAHHC